MQIAVSNCSKNKKYQKLYFIMTVDVDPPIPSNPNPAIVKDGVISFLKLFDKYAIKATFFVPARVAEMFTDVMGDVVKHGHELACHGLEHDSREAVLGINEELRNIRKATEIIESVTGVRPVGFRAPLFKINSNCWLALQKNNYLYDSSVVCSPFYKCLKLSFPLKPFYIPVANTRENCSLLEIPVSINPFLPFPLGGAFLRVFGSNYSKLGIKMNFLHQNPVVFHIHPKDVDPRTLGLAWWRRRNTDKCMKMFEGIIKYAKQNGAMFITAYELARLYKEYDLNK